MQLRRFASYCWAVLAYNLGIILWGAYVRASGSGAGCGSHWPLCNGQIIPRNPQIETVIEFTHRLSSGAALIMIAVMLVWAFRAYPKGHVVRLGAGLSSFFIITEALVGAGLVLFELVADNASIARALFMAVHLANTFLLLGALTLTAWWASGGVALRLRGQGSALVLLVLGLVGMLVLGVSGAVTALGDTLYPASSLAEGLRQDLSPTAHFLIRLRVLHPTIAIGMGLYLVFAASCISVLRPDAQTKRFARGIVVLFLIQLGVGALNVFLLAPIPMQLVHLLLADFVWITLILLSASAFAERPVEESLLQPLPQPEHAL
ncbi:MAG: COX15/CtaA family protein [Chloroflexi bacterium]|nr:COX15/CtaA family protein [Chloroflexota bacterium]